MKKLFLLCAFCAFGLLTQSFTSVEIDTMEEKPDWIYNEGTGTWHENGDYDTVIHVLPDGTIYTWDWDCESGYSNQQGPF